VSDAVGRHAVALASVAELAARAGAQRVVLLIDEGEHAPATMIEWAGDGTFELTQDGNTEPVVPAAIAQVVPTELPDVTPVPASALTVDAETGELAAPLGVLAALAGAVVALAAAFGGRSVATAEFATREPLQPFMLAARPGEPVVAQLGGEAFAFPDGWP
jgi:hypothetical protein